MRKAKNNQIEQAYHLSVGGMGYCGIVYMSMQDVLAQGYVKKHCKGRVVYSKPHVNAYGLMLGYASIQLVQ